MISPVSRRNYCAGVGLMRFFLDLPTGIERKEILNVHIKKRGRDPKDYSIDQLVEESQGFVGAEIEQVVIDAMYLAFN